MHEFYPPGELLRREFLLGTCAAATLPLGALAQAPDRSVPPTSLANLFRARNDARISNLLELQSRDENSPFYGGFPNAHGIYFVGSAAWNTLYLAAGFVSPDSEFFQSPEVQRRLELAIHFLGNMQHADGTVDLVSTNFHSPPDTGFAVEPIALALGIVRRLQADRLLQFQQTAGEFLEKAGHALAIGGVHTPNHRWVVCMALLRIHQLMPNNAFIKRVNAWLAEGIDIDADGQYAERSTATYTPLVNRCLMTMAQLLQRPELYEPVRKNLDMTQYLVHPNGELVTEISRRQDVSQRRLADRYYYPYRTMATIDGNADFAAMALFIERTVGRAQVSDYQLYVLETPELQSPLPAPAPLAVDYERRFLNSELVRIRRNRADASILANNPAFFTMHKGDAVLQALRLATAFFGKGQFVASSIKHENGAYILEQQLSGPYFQPLPDDLIPGDGNWVKLPKSSREQSEVQQLDARIEIREDADSGREGSFTIHFRLDGTARVPWAIEFSLRPGGEFSGVQPVKGVQNAFLADSDMWAYRVGHDELQVAPGHAEHQWTQLRGALPKLHGKSVYLTGYTPLDLSVTVG